MRKVLMAVLATATLGSVGFVAAPSSAQAQTAQATNPIAALQNGDLETTYVQWRRGYRGGYRGAYRGRPYYGRPGYYYRRDRGNALAAGAVGLATGAIIGGALAQQQAQSAPVYVAPNQNSVAYCSQRFRSYDPASGTYLGYDGLRHPCP
jgi:BA14K-like protein